MNGSIFILIQTKLLFQRQVVDTIEGGVCYFSFRQKKIYIYKI